MRTPALYWFYIYTGQYQPKAASTLRQIETPAYVTVVRKPRSYETDDGNTTVAVRPESITQVDEPTRDRWVVETADQTVERLQPFDEETNAYAQMVRDEYGERPARIVKQPSKRWKVSMSPMLRRLPPRARQRRTLRVSTRPLAIPSRPKPTWMLTLPPRARRVSEAMKAPKARRTVLMNSQGLKSPLRILDSASTNETV